MLGVVLAIGVLLGLSMPSEAQAQSCPNIAGTWVRDNGTQQLTWTQQGCVLTASYNNPNYQHTLRGEAFEGGFRTATVRVTVANGCTVTLFGRLTNISQTTYHADVDGSSGGCGIDANYKESSVWIKRP